MEGKSAKDKGTSVKGEFLPSLIALFSDEVDRLKFPDTVFGNIDLRKERVDPMETCFARCGRLEFRHNSGVAVEIKRRLGDGSGYGTRMWQSGSHAAPCPHTWSRNVAKR